MINIKYLNKNFFFKKKITLLKIINKLNIKKKKYCIGAYIKKNFFDLNHIIKKNIKLKLIYINTNIGKIIIKNACSFIMGNAIKNIWPNTKRIKLINTKYGFIYYFENKKNIFIKEKKK